MEEHGRLRLEIEDAGGGTVHDRDYVDLIRSGWADDAPGGSLLWPTGGTSGGGCRMGWWLWPLSPPGTLRFRVAWPELGVEPSEAVLEASRLLDAVPFVRTVWPAEKLE